MKTSPGKQVRSRVRRPSPATVMSAAALFISLGGVGYAAIFGEGDAPWARIFKAAETTGGVEYYLIEQEAGPSDEQLARAEKCLANWRKMRA